MNAQTRQIQAADARMKARLADVRARMAGDRKPRAVPWNTLFALLGFLLLVLGTGAASYWLK